MGGKHKQAQRTKNNVRPSSSGRTAELLSNTSTNIPFVGFTALKDGSTTSSLSSFVEESDAHLDTNFQLVLKKMNKKDTTTKLKALQEFVNLCHDSEPEAVKAVLPFWPRLYSLLAVDIEHRVREAVHIAHKTVISKVKRAIAPYFKSIAGVWFASQYDTYPPAASAATAAFQEAFSPTKLSEAIVFSQEEILNYIYDNLINQTAQTLSNPKTTSSDEMEAKYTRVVVSSLQGYSALVNSLTSDQLKQSEDSNKKLVASPKFWKYAKHKDPLVRYSFFQTTIALCQNGRLLLTGHSNNIVNAVFNQLDETDAMVLPVIWDSALHVLLTMEECWSASNVEKKLLPKLHLILKEGGKGNAKMIFPHLLPLISKIPVEMIGDRNVFYNKFFENIRFGLNRNTVNQSMTEGKVVATTFIECLKYIIMTYKEDEEFTSNLVTSQLMLCLEQCLDDDNLLTKSVSGPLMSEVSNLIQHWIRNHEYKNLLQLFWKQLAKIYQDPDKFDERILKNHLLFLQFLNDPNKLFEKKNCKVKFVDDTRENVVFEKQKTCSHQLQQFVSETITFYFEYSNKHSNQMIVKYVILLMREFNSEDMLKQLAKCNNVGLFGLFHDFVLKWLADDAMCCGDVLELSLEILVTVEDVDEQSRIINCLDLVWNQTSLVSVLCKCFIKYKHVDVVKNWVKDESFVRKLLEYCWKMLTQDDPAVLEFISVLFSDKNQLGEFLLEPACASGILSIVSERVMNCGNKTSIVKLGERLLLQFSDASVTYIDDSYEQLLLSLFNLSNRGAGVELTWRRYTDDDIVTITDKLYQNVDNNMSDIVVEFVVQSLDKFVQKTIEYDGETVERSDFDVILDISQVFLKFERSCQQWFEKLSVLSCSNCSCVGLWEEVNSTSHNLDFKNIENIITKSSFQPGDSAEYEDQQYVSNDLSNVSDAIKYHVKCDLIVLSVVKLVMDYYNKLEHEDCCEENQEIPLIKYVLKLIYNTGCLRNFCLDYKNTVYYAEVSQHLESLLKEMKEMIASTSVLERQYLFNTCKRLIHENANWRNIGNVVEELFEGATVSVEYKFDKDVVDNMLESLRVCSNVPVVACLLTRLVSVCPELLSQDGWDFVFINLDNWSSSLLESVDDVVEEQVGSLRRLTSSCKLLMTCLKCFENNHTREDTKRVMPIVCQSWNHVVKQEVYNKYYQLWFNIVERLYGNVSFSAEIGKVLELLGEVVLFDLNLKKKQDVARSIEESKTLYTYILSRNIAVQVTCFKILLSLVPDLIQVDTETFQNNMSTLSQESDDGVVESLYKYKPGCKWTCANLQQVFKDAQIIVDTLLSEFKIGDSCKIETYTDSYSYTHACLLLWCVMLEMCGSAHAQLKYQYANWLKETGFSSNILSSLFKLMPQNVLLLIEMKEGCVRYFDELCLDTIEQLSCYVYRMCLQRLPALVRQWWGDLDNKSSSIVDKVTCTYVSPLLIANELKNVQDHDRNFDKMEIKVYPNAREVRGIYVVDESSMDVIITLPANYPLGIVNIDSSNLIVSTAKWRNWLFSMRMYLLHENSTIFQSLIIWKNNLDRKFEGVEECYICYSVLQGNNFEIPKNTCRNCKKKYHMSCLYKWFCTSTKSTCPLCRSMF